MKIGALLSTTCITSIILAAAPALGQTTVTGSSTTPLATSSAGNVTIAKNGELKVASGVAVTVNSSNTVTLEKDNPDDLQDAPGRITTGADNGATGILVQPNLSTTITNNGRISVLETYKPVDADANGVADGALASATNRYGIRVQPGGTVTGGITNTGVITVEGQNSAGISVESTLNGSLVQKGSIRLVGANGAGVRTADVTGDVIMEGSTLVTGAGTRALSVEGDVGGTVRIQGTVAHQTTFVYDDAGSTIALSRTDLRQGAPAVAIEGNVARGVVVATPPIDRDSANADEDGDGIPDAEEGRGVITAYGNGPALRIGSSDNITIGALAGAANEGYSLRIEGGVTGIANYSSTDAFGVVIGGQGGTVTLPGGIGVTGAIQATTQDSAATALLINAGANVGKLYNSGTIRATIVSQGEGEAYGVYDLSGTLRTIENTGFINASGSTTDIVQAINLSAATSDVNISQFMNADDIAARKAIEDGLPDGQKDPTVYTAIVGNIVTGSGNDTLSANAGQIIGSTYFNAGNDRLLLSGDALYSGKVFFGDGVGTADLSDEASFAGTLDFNGTAGSLTVSDDAIFFGTIANGAASSVVVEGGQFGSNGVTSFAVGSLTVKSGGTLNAYIDGSTQTSSLIQAGTASFESGSKVTARVNSLIGAEGSYTILTAGTLTGAPDLDDSAALLPFIFDGEVSVEGNSIVLDIRRKESSELGLRSAATSAYDAIIDAAVNSAVVSQTFLGINDGQTLQTQIDQMLPDHAGGLFDTVTRATRLVSQHVMDRDSQFDVTEPGEMSIWLQPVYLRTNRDAGAGASYSSSGFGLSGGAEWLTGLGYIGGSFAWLNASVENNGGSATIDATQYDLGAFWRTGRSGPLFAYARIGAAHTSFSSERAVVLTANGSPTTFTSLGDWNGWLFSGMGGVSYEIQPTTRFKIRPKLGVEWFQLREDGFTETGGGEAVDLTVADRTSDSLSAIGTVTFSYGFGRPRKDFIPLTLEFEGGRRQSIGGQLGATTANFSNDGVAGTPFTINPGELPDAWTSELRLLAGGWDYTWKIAAGAEKGPDSDPNFSARASLSVAF